MDTRTRRDEIQVHFVQDEFTAFGVCLCLTLNEGDERDDQRRGDRFDPAPHFAGGKASDQNRGYVHSRLITLSHLPIPFLVTSRVSLKRSSVARSKKSI